VVDLDACELHKSGVRQKLGGQPFEVLCLLLEHPGQIVGREELQHRIWPADTFVDYDLALRKAITRLREVLGDSADNPRFIETIPRKGYRFLVPVTKNGDAQAAAPLPAPAKLSTEIPRFGRAQRSKMALGLGTVLLLLVLALAAAKFGWWRSGGGSATQVHSLAVLPLQNLSADAAQEYFSDGITDALITGLAQIGSLKVISRTSSMQYKQTKKSLPEIARELNVDRIVEGTVQHSGEKVRITAQLIDATNDRHLWAASYESDLRDVLAMESEVARSITGAIRIQLTPAQDSRLARASPIDREAYDLYLKGRYFWNKRDPAGLKQALAYFQQAAEKEPGYAPAQTGLADTYALLGAAGYDVLPRADAMEKSRAAARKALLLDDKLAEAHASLAFVIYSYDWDWIGAETEFKRAIALNPNYPTAHQWYSELLNNLGRKEDALAQAQAALTLDPVSVNAGQNMARAHYFARRFDEAIETTRKTLELDPSFAIAHLRLGRAYAAKAMYGPAVKEFQQFSTLSGDIPLATASIGNARARSGDRAGAMRSLDELTKLSKRGRVPSICFALVQVGLGDNDQALSWLEKAYQERSDFLLVLKVDPLFDPLRPDPRFQQLLRRIGLLGHLG
jgi:TolB-like protein/DNA-binding winged helix-turn-helix (wHTH) protein/Flp pilus assembly protein TadD